MSMLPSRADFVLVGSEPIRQRPSSCAAAMEVDAGPIKVDTAGDFGAFVVKSASPTKIDVVDLQSNESNNRTSTPSLEPFPAQILAAASFNDLISQGAYLSEEGDARHAKAALNDNNTSESCIPPLRSSSLGLGYRNQLSSSVLRKLGTAVLAPSASSKEYKRANLVDSGQKMSHDVAAGTPVCDDDVEVQAEGRATKKRFTTEEAKDTMSAGVKAEFLASESDGGAVARSGAFEVAATRATPCAEPAELHGPVAPSPSKSLEALLRETQDNCILAYRSTFRPEEVEFIEESDGSLSFDLGKHPNREEIVRTFVTGLVEKKSDRWAITHFDTNGKPCRENASTSQPSVVPNNHSGSSSSVPASSGFGTSNDSTTRPPTVASFNRTDLPLATVPLDLSKVKTFVSVRRRETDASQRTFYSIRTRTCSIAHAIFVGGFDQILALATKIVIPLYKTSHFACGVRALKEKIKEVQLDDAGLTKLDESTLWLCLHIKNAKEPALLRPHLDEKDIPVRLFHLPYTHYYAVSFEYAVFASETKLANVGGRDVCVQLDVLASTNGLASRSLHQSSTAGCEVMIDVQLSGLKKQTEERNAALADASSEEQMDFLPNSSPARGTRGSKPPKAPKPTKKKQASQQRRVEAHVHGKRFANKGTPSLPAPARAQLLSDLNAATLPCVPVAPLHSGTPTSSTRKPIVFKSVNANAVAAGDAARAPPPSAAAAPMLGSVSGPAYGLAPHFMATGNAPIYNAPQYPSHSLHNASSAMYGPSAPAETPTSLNLASTRGPASNLASLSSSTTSPNSSRRLGEPKRRVQETHTRPMELENHDSGAFGRSALPVQTVSSAVGHSLASSHLASPLGLIGSNNPHLYMTNSSPAAPSSANPNLQNLIQLSAFTNLPVLIHPWQLSSAPSAGPRTLPDMQASILRSPTPLTASHNTLPSQSSSLASSSASLPPLSMPYGSNMSLMSPNIEANMAILAGLNPSMAHLSNNSSVSAQQAALSQLLASNPAAMAHYMPTIPMNTMASPSMMPTTQFGHWPTPTPEQYAAIIAQSGFAYPYTFNPFPGYRN